MVTTPADTPVTTPVDGPAVATDGAPLIHVPPKVASDKAILCVAHTAPGPVMAAGVGFTVMSLV
jgi:hypothetical protein